MLFDWSVITALNKDLTFSVCFSVGRVNACVGVPLNVSQLADRWLKLSCDPLVQLIQMVVHVIDVVVN